MYQFEWFLSPVAAWWERHADMFAEYTGWARRLVIVIVRFQVRGIEGEVFDSRFPKFEQGILADVAESFMQVRK